ncbi:hypothetical protein JCM8097_005734 [Rhodosporidiobolus ruineniae]
MLDRLAPELILHVVSFLPRHGPIDLNEERLSTLSSLSLVSRHFRKVVHPKLFEAFRLPDWNVLKSLEGVPELLKKHGGQTRVFSTRRMLGADSLKPVLEACPALIDVRLILCTVTPESFAGPLANLKHLVLDRSNLFDIAVAPILSNLVSLSIALLTVRPPLMEDFLTPRCLPSLRALAVHPYGSTEPPRGCEYTGSRDLSPQKYPRFDNPAFLRQLDIFQCVLRYFHTVLPVVQVVERSVPVLVTIDLWDEGSVTRLADDDFGGLQRRNLYPRVDWYPGSQLYTGSTTATGFAVGRLHELEACLHRLSLSTLFLPLNFPPEVKTSALAFTAARDRVVATCERQGVQVHWVGNSSGEGPYGSVCEEFWRWAKEKKAKLAVAQQEGKDAEA